MPVRYQYRLGYQVMLHEAYVQLGPSVRDIRRGYSPVVLFFLFFPYKPSRSSRHTAFLQHTVLPYIFSPHQAFDGTSQTTRMSASMDPNQSPVQHKEHLPPIDRTPFLPGGS